MKISELIAKDHIFICGKKYKLTICEKMADVDADETEPLAGQCRIFDKEIRVFNHPSADDTLHTTIHECLHGIAEELNLEILQGEENHKSLDLLALLLSLFLIQNGIVER